jgi:hypothetical protein
MSLKFVIRMVHRPKTYAGIKRETDVRIEVVEVDGAFKKGG